MHRVVGCPMAEFDPTGLTTALVYLPCSFAANGRLEF